MRTVHGKGKDDALARACTTSVISEAILNYPLSDEPLHLERDQLAPVRSSSSNQQWYYDDADFWQGLATVHNREFSVKFYELFISEWVARVPGLYWQKNANARRRPGDELVEAKVGYWTTYKPAGKSRIVSGGVGTLRFPPSEDGYRLVTLTSSANASTGVPVLISDNVWRHHRLREGCVIAGEGIWRDMPLRWAAQFPIVASVRKGCMVLDRPQSIKVTQRDALIEAHPFSIMEYIENDVMKHDFVFATIQVGHRSMRKVLSDFFDDYRNAQGRSGRYLTSADVADPLWDAEFASPEDMRRRKKSELNVLVRRVEESIQGVTVTEDLMRWCSRRSSDDLQRIGTFAGIPPGLWFEGGRASDEAIRLIDAANNQNKIPALLRVIAEDF
jgi:hypothetical protein